MSSLSIMLLIVGGLFLLAVGTIGKNMILGYYVELLCNEIIESTDDGNLFSV